jgi:diphosphomevalonate decarboxylase
MATSKRSGRATARAGANFALVKYWGKADARLNVPAVGSISITLDSLYTETTVELAPELASDELTLDGKPRAEELTKLSACVDLLRRKAGVDTRVRVTSRNNFPTAAGLASSASGFAALVRAAEAAFGLALTPRERSIVARQGSGSAARSIFGGFVEMHAGAAADGTDSFAEPLLDGAEWPLEVVIAVTAKGEKETGSRSGMTRSAASSPYYAAWVAAQPPDLEAARAAISARDFAALAAGAEHNSL